MRYMTLLAAVFAVYALFVVSPGGRFPDCAKTIILLTNIITSYILVSDKFDDWTVGSDDIWIGC